jgi:hypothetical protein
MKYLLAILIFAFNTIPAQSLAQSDTARLNELERRVTQLERQPRPHPRSEEAAGGAAFVCGAVCALWAQQTGRNAWLWFFLGLFFNVITLLVLLYKNSNDKKDRSAPTV